MQKSLMNVLNTRMIADSLKLIIFALMKLQFALMKVYFLLMNSKSVHGLSIPTFHETNLCIYVAHKTNSVYGLV